MRPAVSLKLSSVPMGIAASLLVAAPAVAASPSAGMISSTVGFVGCTTPGTTPGQPNVDHCFVALPSSGGSLQVEGWTYVHTIPASVTTDETITAPASALQVNPDGSFSFNVSFPQMGTVSISGAGGSHVYEADNEAELTYAVASAGAAITSYDPVAGDFLASATVNGQRQTELRGAVWSGVTSGHWHFATTT